MNPAAAAGRGESPDRTEPPRRGTRREGGFFAESVAFGVELGRLERALALTVQQLGNGRYLVTGGKQAHYVDLGRWAPCPCDCDDRVEGVPCKHVLRAMLAEGDERVLLAVATLTAAFRQYVTGLEKEMRGRPIRVTRQVKALVARTVDHPASALTFVRGETGTDSTVTVKLGTTAVVLGCLVHEEDGIAFIPTDREAPMISAA